jgi:iron complex outermembrane receptor protein
MYRENDATGSGTTFAVDAELGFGDYALVTGVDGRSAEHDSLITNPNNGMFFIRAFNDVERDVLSGFAALRYGSDVSNWEVGLRYTDVSANAGDVGIGGMMGMMGINGGVLADAFNAADRSLSFGNVDAVLKYTRRVGSNLAVNIDIGTRTRAPSYQELYLWLPLSATGGLADGRNYIGNLALESERSMEVATGFAWATEQFSISPQVYYKDVSDYIQGVPAESMPANMLATMMSGQGALMFDNVDAEIYGVDLGWDAVIAGPLSVDGTVSYSRGKRTDVSDNLYRLPPLNASLGLSYVAQAWSLRAEVIAYDGQDKVSAFNGEQPTPGYAIANGMLTWAPWENTRLELQAQNLFDRGYQNHLAGINRVMNAEIPAGTRLYGAERTLVFGAVISFR